MTNPEWQIRDLFGRWVDAPSKEAAIGCIKDGTATAIALRRLASSDSGVKVKPLVWRDHRPDSFPEPAWSAQTSFGFYNIEEVSASDSPAYVVRLHAHHFVADKDSLDEAKAAAQADYEARIKSALITTPPSDAGMREALDIAFCAMKDLRDALHREPSVQGRKWVHLGSSLNYAIRKAELALTAPGATTKSDGDEPSSRTAGGFPVAAAPYHAEETGVIQPTRERAGIERGMDQGVTGGESATTNSSPSEPKNYFFENEEDAAEAADNGRNTGGKSYYRPSDPSSTRSEVTALADIAKERQRQRDIEGWTVAHDDGHDAGEMASAAACYALSATGIRGDDGAMLRFWPWDDHWWKPTNRRRDLIKAGALIVAEIERLDRLDQFEIRRR